MKKLSESMKNYLGCENFFSQKWKNSLVNIEKNSAINPGKIKPPSFYSKQFWITESKQFCTTYHEQFKVAAAVRS